MSFTDAVKRPFQDIKTLIIGIVISIIPIVNLTIGMGYFLECAKSTLKKNNKMPEWKDWTKLFMSGLGAFVIGLVYAIPVLIVLMLTIGAGILTGGLSALLSGSSAALMNAFTTVGIGLVFTAIVAVIMSLMTFAAMIRYAETGKFGSAFEMPLIIKKAFNGNFFAGWLISMIYMLVAVGILSFIPLLGPAIGLFIAGVAVYTYLAEIYKKV